MHIKLPSNDLPDATCLCIGLTMEETVSLCCCTSGLWLLLGAAILQRSSIVVPFENLIMRVCSPLILALVKSCVSLHPVAAESVLV